MEIGDVVYLKSGSRPMTIVQTDREGEQTIHTVAWDGGSVRYPEAALTAADPVPALDAARRKATDDEAAKLRTQAEEPAPVEEPMPGSPR